MPKELKKYAIVQSKKPKTHEALSGTVHVLDEKGSFGYVYIGFSEALVNSVGSRMPRGVSPQDPAYLSVLFDPISKEWVVGCRYIAGGVFFEMWASATKPTWINKIHKGTYAANRKAKNAASGRGKRAAEGSRDTANQNADKDTRLPGPCAATQEPNQGRGACAEAATPGGTGQASRASGGGL